MSDHLEIEITVTSLYETVKWLQAYGYIASVVESRVTTYSGEHSTHEMIGDPSVLFRPRDRPNSVPLMAVCGDRLRILMNMLGATTDRPQVWIVEN